MLKKDVFFNSVMNRGGTDLNCHFHILDMTFAGLKYQR